MAASSKGRVKKIKDLLRKVEARTREALIEAIGTAISAGRLVAAARKLDLAFDERE